MRLIDIDALIEDLTYDVELDSRSLNDMDFVGAERNHLEIERDCKQNAIDLIRNVKTVEAIPVDWIIEWEKREENYYRYKDMVRFMIYDWRKENK